MSGKPGRSNEDGLVSDPDRDIHIVADGVSRTRVSGRYPAPSPARLATDWFLAASYAFIRGIDTANEDPRAILTGAARAGNLAVRTLNGELFGGEIDWLGRDLAGTVAILALMRPEGLWYAYLGDPNLWVDRGWGMERITVPQTIHVARHRREAGMGDDVTLRIRRDMRNNPDHPWSYGVFTGEERAMAFLKHGFVSTVGGRRFILASDGLDAYLLRNPLAGAHLSARAIVEYAQIQELIEGAPDDKTLIVLDR